MTPAGARRPRPLTAAIAGALLLFAAVYSPASAQARGEAEFSWSAEGTVIGANLLLGGISAGVAALMRGDPFARAFAQGAGGGGLVYAGKRIGAARYPGAGLLGRQVASVGGSIIGNAVAGRRSFDQVALAAGPVRLYVGSGVSDGFDVRLDVISVVAVGFWVWQGGELDFARSLSSGAVVLGGIGDLSNPGMIAYHSTPGSERHSYVLSHEQVHVLQYDQSFLSWGEPIEAWVGRRVPWLRGPLTYLEFNLPVLATTAFLGFFVWERHEQQPWEQEAMYLGRTSR